MNKIKAYIKEAYNELVHKVTWPSLSELQTSAVVVLIASLIISLILLVMDMSSNKLLGIYYGS